jgi:hypothetical protein
MPSKVGKGADVSPSSPKALAGYDCDEAVATAAGDLQRGAVATDSSNRWQWK